MTDSACGERESITDSILSDISEKIGLSFANDRQQVAAFVVSNFILTGLKEVITEGLGYGDGEIISLIDLCSNVLR